MYDISNKFPKDEEIRKKWEHAVRRKGWTSTSASSLCSIHFRAEDLDTTSPFRTYVKKGAVPSIFPSHPAYLQPEIPEVS